jgi:hypothetical protein
VATIVLLRNRGAWRTRNQVMGPPRFVGEFVFEPADPQMWGRTMQARLIDPARPDHDLLNPLRNARIVQAREGGQFVKGMEYFHRGAKSKPEGRRQLWWCMFELERGMAALARMNARSSTGFHPNDDDADSWPDEEPDTPTIHP